ncbi:MAG: hypothetical protein WBA74_24450 [Cyclobacteriaceae bacterium]
MKILKRQSLIWLLLLWSLGAYAQTTFKDKSQIKQQLLKELKEKQPSKLQGSLLFHKKA